MKRIFFIISIIFTGLIEASPTNDFLLWLDNQIGWMADRDCSLIYLNLDQLPDPSLVIEHISRRHHRRAEFSIQRPATAISVPIEDLPIEAIYGNLSDLTLAPRNMRVLLIHRSEGT